MLFQALFSALSLYLRFSDQLLALRAFGGLVLLLVWLYLMTNILILGRRDQLVALVAPPAPAAGARGPRLRHSREY